MDRRALITGIAGQDGSYLTELLQAKGYKVYGLRRQGVAGIKPEHAAIYSAVEMIDGDLRDSDSLVHALEIAKPHEIYNLASQSNPSESWRVPLYTAEVNALGAQELIEMAWNIVPEARIFQASSSEMFGNAASGALDETVPLLPLTPYAAAKAYTHQVAGLLRNYRGQFIACGILFNHESVRRPMNYVVQKISYGAACIGLGIEESDLKNENGEPIVAGGRIALGNLDVVRDWGFAGDYVQAMWLTLQHSAPEDFVIGTGIGHSIRDLCAVAFQAMGLNWSDHISVDPRLARKSDRPFIVAKSDKARQRLGWTASTGFDQLVTGLVQFHRRRLEASIPPRG
jgi:GDPmannose 4,6-dehydratase